MMPTSGVVYTATKTSRHIWEAHQSARSLRAWCPNIPITVFTDRTGDFDPYLFTDVRHLDKPVNKREPGSKVAAIQLAPYDYNLYLDTDTFICSKLTPLFQALNSFDIAMAIAPRRVDPAGIIAYGESLPEWFPEYNTGVILCRRGPGMQRLANRWLQTYHQLNKWNDQMAMRVALYHEICENGLKLYTLPPEYNCRIIMLQFVGSKVHILHARDEQNHTLLEWASRKINSHDGARIWIPRHGIFRWRDWEYVGKDESRTPA